MWKSKSRTSIPHTRALLSRLIGIFIGGGIATAAVACFNSIVLFTSKSTDLFVLPAFILSKLYAISLLVQLNANSRIVGDRDEESSTFVHSRNILGTDLINASGGKATWTRRTFSKFLPSPNNFRGARGGSISNNSTLFPIDGISVSVTTHQETAQDVIPLESKNTIVSPVQSILYGLIQASTAI